MSWSRLLALVIAGSALTPACSAPGPTGALPDNGALQATRTYSEHIKPITASQGCRTCHANTAVGNYETDKLQRNNILRMARTNGATAGLTDEQVQAVEAWVAAGAPDDSTRF